MKHQVRIEHWDRLPLAVVRRRARPQELRQVVPEACGVVWNVIRAHKVVGAGRHVAVYRDGQINVEVGVEMDAPFAGHGEVVASSTPSGPVAATTHYGPYGTLHLAHEAIRAWCRDHARACAGPSWETYGHWQDAWNRDPSRITTDVYYLLVSDEASGDRPTAAAGGIQT